MLTENGSATAGPDPLTVQLGRLADGLRDIAGRTEAMLDALAPAADKRGPLTGTAPPANLSVRLSDLMIEMDRISAAIGATERFLFGGRQDTPQPTRANR